MRQRRDWRRRFSPFLFYLKDGDDTIPTLNIHSPIVQERLLQIKNDPVLWARAFLITYNPITKKDEPWTARWYQAEMLRDNSQFKVYLNGRRTGKCLPGWVKILNPDTGELTPVETLYKNHNRTTVATMDESTFTVHSQSDCPIVTNGIKDVYRVTLQNGKTIDATSNHPLYTKHGWVEIGNLNPGDKVAAPTHLPFFGSHTVSKDTIHNLVVQSRREQKIPNNIFTLQKDLVAAFLSEYCNSTKIFDNPTYDFEIQDESVRQDISHLLLRFGIKTELFKWGIRVGGMRSEDDKSIERLQTEILYHDHTNVQTLLHKMKQFIKDRVGGAISSDLDWQPIVSIELLGKYLTYDLSVPNTHNFVANDIIVHNTEVMCVESLFAAMNNKNFVCLFATPYESQIRLIFDRLTELIQTSPLVKSELVSSTKNPFRIILRNGSKIVGFTTGAKTSSNAASLRGQRSDLILLDEMDFHA